MLWFITLLVLALAAFLAIKALKATAARKTAEQERLEEGSGLEGRLNHETPNNASTSGPSTVANTATKAAASVALGAAAGAAAGAALSTGQGDGASVSATNRALDTGDSLSDTREMIKILNLADSDAGRLDISREQFTALRSGNKTALPPADKVNDVAARLRNMLA